MRILWLNKISGLISQCKSCQIGGLWGSAYAYLLSHIIRQIPLKDNPKIYLLITPTIEEAETALEDLPTFLGDAKETIYYFPFSETGEITSESDIFKQQLQTLTQLMSMRSARQLIIAPIQAITQKIPTPQSLLSNFIVFKEGDNFDIDKLTKTLISQGFSRTPEVTLPGEFSIRGGIMDIFTIDLTEPIRIELFGNKIESIRTFDPADQISRTRLKDIKLCLSKLDKEEAYLFDYLPEDILVIYKEPPLINEFLKTQEKIIETNLNKYPHLNFQTLPVSAGPDQFNYQITSLQRFSGGLAGIGSELESLYKKGLSLTIFCTHKAEMNRLKELLGSDPVRSNPGDAVPPKAGQTSNGAGIEIKIGRLNTGFIFPEISRAFISYNELFNRYRQPRRFRSVAEVGATRLTARPAEPFGQVGQVYELPLLELKKGDFVVHLKYGIGRYQGIEQIKKNGYVQEYLVLEYQDRALVYVPVSALGGVEKYIAGTDRPPQLSRLGTGLWEARKERVRQAISQFAREFVEIQAIRETQQGIAFPSDTEWQDEFEASFPYEETPDQVSLNEVIKQDMESSQPMDRLICGDVGYGKTELAMRAAFKSATAGYQVAILVPTTVLAQQHYQTFCERMADYPINIEMLSRFRKKAEQRKITERIKAGTIDIIIGTHRLVQPDIQFKNLGLIIIDEEQRFGVEHKERLRKLKALVDALTLTATPIPRTLHMSLLGIRDISALATPPLDRRAVITQIIPFDESIIRMAIQRELNRQGQIYFVHNRIYDIQNVADRIKAIVPEARITIAHGQLPEAELEETMKLFINGEIDILISTNIIESGLDIPRANTIFIHNADNFGLADLHQLRGRVGRYKHQAYAYLITSSKLISYDATKRLKAITEFNELGAGFKIALRDMEIRGVGNILGREQHGYIATVGYDLYCKMLENAVKILKQPLEAPGRQRPSPPKAGPPMAEWS